MIIQNAQITNMAITAFMNALHIVQTHVRRPVRPAHAGESVNTATRVITAHMVTENCVLICFDFSFISITNKLLPSL